MFLDQNIIGGRGCCHQKSVYLVLRTILNDSQIIKLSLAMVLIKIVQIKISWERCILCTHILIKSSTWTLIIRKIAILHHLSFLSYIGENGNIKKPKFDIP